jgi:trehalose 6-phosphate synthase/phosphatase
MRVISVIFTIPYTFSVLPVPLASRRKGDLALCDSFSYLTASKTSHTLIGWTGEIEQSNRLTQGDKDQLEKLLQSTEYGKIIPVWLADEDKSQGRCQSRWRRYGELEIHDLFHYKQSDAANGPGVKKAWADYEQLNKHFADRIVNLYRPGDIIIIHDYNLMLLPALLRIRLPRAYIGFYLHIPFPSSELFRCIGQRRELLEGILGANMIGLQSPSYIRHFESSCAEILGLDDSLDSFDVYSAHVAVEAFPIGIDYTAIEKSAFHDPTVANTKDGICQLFAGKKIIIGRDRLETFCGVTQKLHAFELFLRRHPEWCDKVILIQIGSPPGSNTKVQGGECKISDLVGEINRMHGSLGFTPVQYLSHYPTKEKYYALLQVADLALITSVREGMNTTSLEYIVCQKHNHGPLILSEFSGTSENLSSAIHVNPWDLSAVADAINNALCMSAEAREAQSKQLYHHVVTNNTQYWTDTFIQRLLTNFETHKHRFYTPHLDREKLLHQYKQAGKRLLMFDYDGTLTPIVQNPAAAIPTNQLYSTLKTLTSNPSNTVWIISGRDQNFLDQWLGLVPGLGLSAEHGSFIRRPKVKEWENIAEHTDMGWQQDVVDVFKRYTNKTPGPLLSVFPVPPPKIHIRFSLHQHFPL